MSVLNPTGDFPQILTSNYGEMTSGWIGHPMASFDDDQQEKISALLARAGHPLSNQQLVQSLTQSSMSTRRIVQVFIADPDINVPLESALLFKSEPKFTDATDQELYFEVPITDLLKAHNEKRKTWLDKDASRKAGKDIALEPAKIRDLKMVVVNIAQF